MKIKIYCVTYKGHKRLEHTLSSLFYSDIKNYEYEINIINNHSDFKLNEEYVSKVNVLHNVLRPDFSEGHLTRNWNQGIINGFKDPDNPDCDIVVNIQDDVIFREDCFTKLEELHKKYDLIQNGQGDALISYNINAVKNIGLWDERFCSISFQVLDFLLKCKMFHSEKCSINDLHHKRILNPINPNNLVESSGYLIRPNAREIDNSWPQGDFNTKYCANLIEHKYGFNCSLVWEKIKKGDTHRINSFIYYPYFERKLNLNNKNYFNF